MLHRCSATRKEHVGVIEYGELTTAELHGRQFIAIPGRILTEINRNYSYTHINNGVIDFSMTRV